MVAEALERGVRLRARQHLRSGAAVIAVGVGLAGLSSVIQLGVPCPFLAITGLQCPLCGGTRMAASLATGEFAMAWRYNAAALVAVVALLMAMVWWVAQAAGLRGTTGWSVPHWLSQRLVYRVVAVVAIVWTVARNLF